MAGSRGIPVGRVAEVLGGIRSGQARRHECVRVAIEVEPGAPRELVSALREAFVPETATGLVHVGKVSQGALVRVNPDTDVAVVVAGEHGASAPVARAFASSGVPCALVVESSVDAPEGDAPASAGYALVAAASPEALLDKLAGWLAESCGKDIALAANFPFTRDAVALRCVRQRSAQNAVVGLIPFGSGADLPIMVGNQVLMALDVAGSYGKGADSGRLAEVGCVVGGAFASRALSRRLTRALPVLGPIVKPAVAYAATFAMGRLLMASHAFAGSLPAVPWARGVSRKA